MTKVRIAGHPQLSLAHQDDEKVQARTVAALKTMGFKLEAGLLVPPEGSAGKDVIAAITAAYQKANDPRR